MRHFSIDFTGRFVTVCNQLVQLINLCMMQPFAQMVQRDYAHGTCESLNKDARATFMRLKFGLMLVVCAWTI